MSKTAENEIPLQWETATAGPHHVYLWPALRRLLPEGSGLTVLDAGCGNGWIAKQLARAEHLVTGIDLSAEGVELARRSCPEGRFEVASAYDDLRALRPAAGWDLVVALELIEHLYFPRRFLLNVFGQWLRPGGSVILSTPHHGYLKNLALSVANGWDRHFTAGWEGGHIKFFSKRTLSELLREAGFSEPAFTGAGRIPFLWKSLMVRAVKAT